MTLVIKNKNVSLPSGEKLYRDALVTNGTIYLTDFSNRGATNNFSVKNSDIVMDLARESSVPLGVIAQGQIITNKSSSELTAKKGFTADGITGPGAYGLNIQAIAEYLTNHQNNNILFNLWVNTGVSGNARGFIRTYGGGTDWSNTAFRANISNTGNLTMTIAGVALQSSTYYPLPNSDVRLAYLYQGVGKGLKVWINGVYKGETAALATGFSAANMTIIIGKPEISATGNQTFYRMLIEDLTVSGRTAEAVVEKDYNYVNALGEYEGIPKRPFANL